MLKQIRWPVWLWNLAGFLLVQTMKAWMSGMHYRVARYDRSADPAERSFRGPVIFIFWHEYIPAPIYLRPGCRLAMLISQHQDAEILEHIAMLARLETVRGSTHRGGTAALRKLLQRARGKSLAITPDGPRGPRRQLAQGCIYLSSRLQIPIVPLGFGYDRPWRYRRAWDRFAIPRPSSRCRAVMGPQLQVPPNLDREGIERYRQWVEATLNQVTELAEEWAESRWEFREAEILVRSSPPSRGQSPVGPEHCSPLTASEIVDDSRRDGV